MTGNPDLAWLLAFWRMLEQKIRNFSGVFAYISGFWQIWILSVEEEEEQSRKQQRLARGERL